jgi:hypothetical protein
MDSTGVCTRCSLGWDKGCLLCYAKDPEKCLVCRSGFYMNTGKYECCFNLIIIRW